MGRGLQYDLEHKVVVIQWEEKVVLEENIVCVQGKRLTYWKFPGMSVSQQCHAS